MLEEGAYEEARPKNYEVAEPSEDEAPEEDHKREMLNAFIREIYAAGAVKKKKPVPISSSSPKRAPNGLTSFLKTQPRKMARFPQTS